MDPDKFIGLQTNGFQAKRDSFFFYDCINDRYWNGDYKLYSSIPDQPNQRPDPLPKCFMDRDQKEKQKIGLRSLLESYDVLLWIVQSVLIDHKVPEDFNVEKVWDPIPDGFCIEYRNPQGKTCYLDLSSRSREITTLAFAYHCSWMHWALQTAIHLIKTANTLDYSYLVLWGEWLGHEPSEEAINQHEYRKRLLSDFGVKDFEMIDDNSTAALRDSDTALRVKLAIPDAKFIDLNQIREKVYR